MQCNKHIYKTQNNTTADTFPFLKYGLLLLSGLDLASQARWVAGRRCDGGPRKDGPRFYGQAMM